MAAKLLCTLVTILDRHQWLNVFIVLCITVGGVTIAGDLIIEFLGGVPRFSNNTGYADFYVYCSAFGQFVGWQVGSDHLAGFRASDVARAKVGARSTYEYTATLLMSQPLPASNQYQMDSIIMVTFSGVTPSSFEVTCISVTDNYTSTNRIIVPGNTNAVLCTNSSGHNKIVLDYVITSRMKNKDLIHIFVCGTRDKWQICEVENSQIGFSVQDRVGEAKPIQSSDGNTETGLGIFVTQHPYRITSVIFIFGNSGVTVACLDGNHRVCQVSSDSPATTPIPRTDTGTSHSPNPTEPSVSSISLTLTTPPPRPDNMTSTLSPNPNNMTSTLSLSTGDNFHNFIVVIVLVVVIVAAVVILLTSAAILLIAWICCCKCYSFFIVGLPSSQRAGDGREEKSERRKEDQGSMKRKQDGKQEAEELN